LDNFVDHLHKRENQLGHKDEELDRKRQQIENESMLFVEPQFDESRANDHNMLLPESMDDILSDANALLSEDDPHLKPIESLSEHHALPPATGAESMDTASVCNVERIEKATQATSTMETDSSFVQVVPQKRGTQKGTTTWSSFCLRFLGMLVACMATIFVYLSVDENLVYPVMYPS